MTEEKVADFRWGPVQHDEPILSAVELSLAIYLTSSESMVPIPESTAHAVDRNQRV